ncbi:sarcosine oxidase subunit gamma [Devosia sp. SL43]|uniref:sarcosine oxidase subunit gamma n=1 Tax=Devosia sp. SL43 TaxID=2806348 RepID=UPI001F36A9E1|nr:sarcosine oxidase subunit gamma family protein [Devosia sp. SL43]UJW87313.1 sarcosine oxidase subunit gamma [Devosia sp. SL43]
MFDIRLVSKAALADARFGQSGAIGPKGPGVVLSALPETSLLSLLAAPDAVALLERLAALATHEQAQLRSAGYAQWLLIGAVGTSLDLVAIEAALGRDAALVDLGHARVRISIAGPSAADALAKGCAIDLDPEAFPPGRSAQTLLGHIGVHLTRIGPEAFELIVMRSFALNLWQDLLVLSRAFGVDARAATDL